MVAKSVLSRKNSINLICLPMEQGLLNFPSFPTFRIGSIAQNEKPETPGNFSLVEFFHFSYLKRQVL